MSLSPISHCPNVVSFLCFSLDALGVCACVSVGSNCDGVAGEATSLGTERAQKQKQQETFRCWILGREGAESAGQGKARQGKGTTPDGRRTGRPVVDVVCVSRCTAPARGRSGRRDCE